MSAVPRPSERADFRPDIEGVRALAVVAVVLYHAGAPFLPGGYVGVDVFFVVSGYLITRLLLREIDARGRVRLGRFYGRRVRRLLPVASLVIVATVVASYRWLGFIRGERVASDALASATFRANFRFADVAGDYLGSQQDPSPLRHFWSLAVEEQFYLVWPVLIVAATTVAGGRMPARRVVVGLASVVVVVSLVHSARSTPIDGTWAFYSPFTRAWELAAGGVLAATPVHARWSRGRMVLGWGGVVGIVIACVTFGSTTAYPGVAALVPVVSTVAVIAAGEAGRGDAPVDGALQVILGHPVAQWLGRRSYTWYLWHWPVLVIAAQYRLEQLSLAANLGLCAASLVLAAATSRLVEDPLRFWSFWRGRAVRSLVFGVVLVAATVLAVTVLRDANPRVENAVEIEVP